MEAENRDKSKQVMIAIMVINIAINCVVGLLEASMGGRKVAPK